MLVETIAVRDFRNLADGELELGPGLNLLWGPNGSGKTNLLEATYMALAGRSCRTRDDREAIRFGLGLARAEARIADGIRRRTFMCSTSRGDGRRHLVDGQAAGPDAADLRPALAVFMPDRLALVKGPPSARRSHLDGLCSALWPARAEHRRRYARALAQRNALLGRIRAGAADEASLDAWDAELAASGVELIADRERAVTLLAADFAEATASLGLDPSASITYRPRSPAADAAGLAGELAERRGSDLRRGFTGWGPHLDDVALEHRGRALRRYGSQGQQRTALLGLLFAERRALIDAGRPAPLMLLDDVTSELDLRRRELLVAYLSTGGGQALITATEAEHLPSAAERREVTIRDGLALSTAPGVGAEPSEAAA